MKALIQRELGEEMTDQELASAIGVSVRTLENILTNKFLEDPTRWDKEVCRPSGGETEQAGFSAFGSGDTGEKSKQHALKMAQERIDSIG
jgi:hypothetical protein